MQWKAESLADGLETAAFFIKDKGMRGGGGANLSEKETVFVYVF